MPQPTERWSDGTLTPQKGAVRAFDAPGYTSKTAAITAVINYFGVRPGAVHPEDNSMFVMDGGIDAKTNKGPSTFIVTVQYGYLVQTIGIGLPLQQPTRWEISIGSEPITTDLDAYGNPITNSAGVPFDPKPTRTINTLEIAAYKFFPNFSIATALQYMNKVNLASIDVKSLGTVPARSMKCLMICPTAPIVLSQPSPLEVLVRFRIRGPLVSGLSNDPAFALRLIDQGYSGWYSASDTVIKPGDFSEPDTTNVGTYRIRTQPTLLNGDGQPLQGLQDQGVRVGTAGKTCSRVPTVNSLASTVQRKGTGKAVALLFNVEDAVDFGPLIASL